jgi:hypothetical protein
VQPLAFHAPLLELVLELVLALQPVAVVELPVRWLLVVGLASKSVSRPALLAHLRRLR